jgi:EPS-associated MarR family transcriptional regulator
MNEERQLKAMRLLEGNPEMTQRELAKALGISLGAVNFCLKALADKGWIKIENFKNNPRKLGYLYLLTPRGIAAKTKLTVRFLTRKLIEYDALKAEIEALEKELLRGV